MSTARAQPPPGAATQAPREDRRTLVHVAQALVVLVTAVVLWLIFSVSLGNVLRYLAYEAAFTLVPGVLAYMAFTGSRRLGLREIGLGWPLGYALELAAFAATAALGARGLFWIYPPLIIGLGGIVLLLGRRARTDAETPDSDEESQAWGWGWTVLVVLLLFYVAERYFALNPLPGVLEGPVSYAQDQVFQVALAAEALNHWPVTVPNAAGLSLHYHYFAYLHMAAVSQVTDIELSVVNLRLWLVPVLALIPLQLVAMTRSLGFGSWAGIVAAALIFLVGAFDPWPVPPSEFFTHVWQSASYGFGLIFFLPLAWLIGEQLSSAGEPGDLRRWVLIAAFAAAASGAKSTIVPVCVLGILLVGAAALWIERRQRLRERILLRRVVIAGGIMGLAAIVARFVLYPGTTSELEVHPFRETAQLNPAAWINSELDLNGVPKAIVVGVAALLETGKLLAPLALGIWVLVRVAGRGMRVAEIWLLALLTGSLAIYYALTHVGGSDIYFFYYGYVAAAVVAGSGLVILWRRYLPTPRLAALPALALCLVVLAVWATDGPPGTPERGATPPAFYRYLLDEVTWAQTNSNLTPELYEGMRWIASSTPEDAVLGVNNRWQDAAGFNGRYCYMSAFAERRVLLECEEGTEQHGNFATFPELQADPAAPGALSERARLEFQMFYAPGAAIARESAALAAQRYGVTHAVLDLVHARGAAPQNVERLGRVIFRNDALIVVKLPGPTAA